MQKKVVLFFPETHRLRAEDTWCLPPFSLLAIAAPLLEANYAVTIVDARITPDYRERILAEISDAVCLGISVLTGKQIEQALSISEELKSTCPELPIVWGGYHPTLMPEQTIADPAIDIVVRAQGEVAFKTVVDRLATGESLRGIAGIVFKEHGKAVWNGHPVFKDVNQFPPLPFSLIDLEPHLPDLGFAQRTLSYPSSQGCPFPCHFCAESAAYEQRWCGLAPERVVDDLERLSQQYGADGVILVDNNFFVDEKRVQAICREIIRRRLTFKWAAQGRADRISALQDRTFELLRESGFAVFHVGAESGSDRQLEAVSKKSSRQVTVDCAKVVKKYGLHISFGFIFGFPGETDEDIEQNFSLMEEVTEIQGAYDCIYHFYAPAPGTPLLNKSLEHGAPSASRLQDWATYNTVRGMTPWVSSSYIDRIQRRAEFFYPFSWPNWMFKRRQEQSFLRRTAFHLLHRAARIRYRTRFFGAPLDWWLYKRTRYVLSPLARARS